MEEPTGCPLFLEREGLRPTSLRSIKTVLKTTTWVTLRATNSKLWIVRIIAKILNRSLLSLRKSPKLKSCTKMTLLSS
jgi:hypothetical protein